MSDYPCHAKYGGEYWVDEKCPECGITRRVHKGGSWDWKTKACPRCYAKNIIKDLDEPAAGGEEE